MSNDTVFITLPSNCDFSAIFTAQQDETLGLVYIVGFIIIMSLLVYNNK